jgi:hypothetical protein
MKGNEMAVKLNLGLSKKVGEPNYGSRGASVNIEIEVDPALVGEPTKFLERIRQVFNLVRTSVNEELSGQIDGQTVPHSDKSAQSADSITREAVLNNGHRDGHCNGIGEEQGNGIRLATRAQIKALIAISRQLGIDLARLIYERFHARRADDLSLRQASQLIGELRSSETPATR